MTDTTTDFDPETGARDMIDLTDGHAAGGEEAPRAALPDDIALSDITQKIITALKTVYDPEIPVDIYELGLIYKVDYEEPGDVKIEMTLTAPGCPVAGEMPGWVEQAICRVEGIRSCDVDMTFEPPWSPERMSDEAKLELGWM